jgi:hypothetical protein
MAQQDKIVPIAIVMAYKKLVFLTQFFVGNWLLFYFAKVHL